MFLGFVYFNILDMKGLLDISRYHFKTRWNKYAIMIIFYSMLNNI